MTDSEDREIEGVFLQSHSAIGKIVDFIARKHGLQGPDAEDFASVVHLKLIEDGYAVLRKFRGESSLNTFLAVVIASIFRDFQVSRFGKWRPSATARSLGPVATRLELLLYRDHCSITEAIERVRGLPGFPHSEKELRALISRLPVKERVRTGQRDPDSTIEAAADLPAREVDYPTANERNRIEATLNEVMSALDSEDRLLIRLKYWNGISVADIARTLCTPQKQLYRRLDKLAMAMKAQLRTRGVNEADVRDFLV